jgi:hypothetical protein
MKSALESLDQRYPADVPDPGSSSWSTTTERLVRSPKFSVTVNRCQLALDNITSVKPNVTRFSILAVYCPSGESKGSVVPLFE